MTDKRHTPISPESKWLRIEQLDQSLQKVKDARIPPPRRGWIKEIRRALGMTAAQLARRVGMTQPSLAGLEASENEASISVASLRKIADALECELVYAFVPKRSLKTTLDDQLRRNALQHVDQTAHTIALEAQSVDAQRTEAQANALLAKMRLSPPKNLWE